MSGKFKYCKKIICVGLLLSIILGCVSERSVMAAQDVKKVSLIRVKSGKNKVTVSYKKVSDVAGYQISYATKSDFSNKKSANTTALTKTITGLQGGKKYYVKVRAYIYNRVGNKIYGSYSNVKSFTTKADYNNGGTIKPDKTVKGVFTASKSSHTYKLTSPTSNTMKVQITYWTSDKKESEWILSTSVDGMEPGYLMSTDLKMKQSGSHYIATSESNYFPCGTCEFTLSVPEYMFFDESTGNTLKGYKVYYTMKLISVEREQ